MGPHVYYISWVDCRRMRIVCVLEYFLETRVFLIYWVIVWEVNVFSVNRFIS